MKLQKEFNEFIRGKQFLLGLEEVISKESWEACEKAYESVMIKKLRRCGNCKTYWAVQEGKCDGCEGYSLWEMED